MTIHVVDIGQVTHTCPAFAISRSAKPFDLARLGELVAWDGNTLRIARRAGSSASFCGSWRAWRYATASQPRPDPDGQ